MTPAPRWLLAVLTVLAGLGCAATAARAQPADGAPTPEDTEPARDDVLPPLVIRREEEEEVEPDGAEVEPTEPPMEPPPEPFHLSFTDLFVGMESYLQDRRVRSSIPQRRDVTQTNRDWRVAETLGFSLDGDVYGQDFIDYRASALFGLTQLGFTEKFDRYDNSDHDTGSLIEYDLSADLFKTRPFSINTYARRADDRVARRFLPSLREIQTEAGVSALALTGPVTTEFGFTYRDIDRGNNRRVEDNESLTTSRFYLDSTWAIADNHKLRLLYDHEQEENTYQGSLYDYDTRRDELRLEHELAFGPEDRHRLDTFLRYSDESGDLARDEIELSPRLTLQHTDRFRTIHRYNYYSLDQGAIDFGQHKFDSQALWQATDDLRLSLDGFGLYERVDPDVETRQFGAIGDLTWNKDWSLGNSSVNVNLGYDEARTTGDSGRRVVRSEAHALSTIRPVYLRERGVQPGSIIVHDANYTRLFGPGADYTVTMIDGRAYISRVPWGRIAEGDVVYVDYQYLVSATAEVNTYRTDFRAEHTFPFKLTPYYYFEGRWQEVDETSRATPWYRDNQDRHRFGLRYVPERWSLTGEYEIFDDTVEPYDAWHLTNQISLFRSAAHSLDFRGELSHYQFEGGVDRRRVWYLDLDVRDTMQLIEALSLTFGGAFRREDDSVRGETTGFEALCGLRYTRGYLTVELDLEYDLLSVMDNREQGYGLFLNVRRDLTHLLASSQEAR